jgi:hypothetical protein
MALNRHKFNVLLASIALLGACVSTGISQAEEPPVEEAATGTPAASAEESATTWDKTKEVSGDAWGATKEGSAKAWDATKEGSASAWDTTKNTVQGWQETEPESETDSIQETPAPSQSL